MREPILVEAEVELIRSGGGGEPRIQRCTPASMQFQKVFDLCTEKTKQKEKKQKHIVLERSARLDLDTKI